MSLCTKTFIIPGSLDGLTMPILTYDIGTYFNKVILSRGESLSEALQEFEDGVTLLQEQLNILARDLELEKKWQEIHEINKQYRKLEEETLTKMTVVLNELKK